MKNLRVERTPIPHLLVIRMPVHADGRGWFKENWQAEKFAHAGLPPFRPVQDNISFSQLRGTTRGFHAEPGDKLVSVASGRVFGAWVDLRAGSSFGAVHTAEIDPGVAVYVPRGVANAFQTLEDGSAYTYLTTSHRLPNQPYVAVDLGDPRLHVDWPIALTEAVVSDKDRRNPPLADVSPFPQSRILITGAGGQLGRALAREFPDAHAVTRQELDVSDADQMRSWAWDEYDVVVNAAAYTAVDMAETPEGRPKAWAGNASATSSLASAAREGGIMLVHYSTEYVYDGTVDDHEENEPFSPLGVYGQSKAAGDVAAAGVDRHYVLRPSWLIGDGKNFVRTMHDLAQRGVSPRVVDDQIGRLTFAVDLARATRHLLETRAPYGTYNCSNTGQPMSWFDIARLVFELSGRNGDDVLPISTKDYDAGKSVAPRPLRSSLSLKKLQTTGFSARDASEALREYVSEL